MFRLKVWSSVVFLLALAIQPALAQQHDTAAAENRFALQPIIVTINKLPIRAERIGFAISVLDQAALARNRTPYAAEALRNVTGAYIDEAVGVGGPTIIRLRSGEEVFTQILMDGVQMNENGGFFDLQGFSFGNIDRIEIARGPQSAVWGSAAMTGVVNFVTHAGEPGPARWGLQLEGGKASGENRNYQGSARVSGGGARIRYSAEAGTAFMRGVHSVAHDLKSREGVLRLDLNPASSLELTVIARGIGVESHLPVRDQGATRAPLDPNAQSDRDRMIGLLHAKHSLASDWRHQLRLSVYDEDFVYRDTKDNVSSTEFFIFDESFTYGADRQRRTAEYSLTYEPTGGLTRFTAGGQFEREFLDEKTSGAIGDGEQHLDRDSRALYAELLARPIRTLDILFSSRVEEYEGQSAEYTPRASFVLSVAPSLRLRAALARGFKAPNIQVQYPNNLFIDSNPDLKPERSVSGEIGADVGIGNAAFAATVFHQEFRNLIRTVTQPSNRQINRNLGESDATGVELDTRYTVNDNLWLGLGGAVIRTRIEDNTSLDTLQYPKGEALPFRPKFTFTASAGLRPIDRLMINLRTHFVGEQFVLTERFSGRRVALDRYTTVGGQLEYTRSDSNSLYLRIDNLFDDDYAPAYDQRGTPLTATLGMRIGSR